jgi:hypothetical protein
VELRGGEEGGEGSAGEKETGCFHGGVGILKLLIWGAQTGIRGNRWSDRRVGRYEGKWGK